LRSRKEGTDHLNLAYWKSGLMIKNYEILKIKAMEILDAKDNIKIPLSALIEHIDIY
jgi:hypothetical protein